MGAKYSMINENISNYPVPNSYYLLGIPVSDGALDNSSSSSSFSSFTEFTADDTTFVWWPTGLAWFLQTEVTIFSLATFFTTFYYRNVFPITMQPRHLFLAMSIIQPIVSFSYLGHILWPDMPCMAHILFHNTLAFPVTGIAYSMGLRQLINYQVQFDMAAGKTGTWFVRHKDILKGYKLDFLVISTCAVAFSGFSLSRVIGVRDGDYSVLSLPVRDERCGSLSTAQFIVRLLNSFINLRVQKKLSHKAKDVEEPFAFKQLFNLVTRTNARFVFAYDFPVILKQFWSGIDPTVFAPIAWIGCMIWAFVFSHNFSFFMIWGTIRGARRTLQRKQNTDKVTSRQQATTSASDSKIVRVKTVAQIRERLATDKTHREEFKQYLVQEFCVENMLFIAKALEYRASAGTPDMAELALNIEDMFIRQDAMFEINVSFSLRKKVSEELKQVAASVKNGNGRSVEATSTDLLHHVEEEVYKMMIDPYNRFMFRKFRDGGETPPATASAPQEPLKIRTISASAISPPALGQDKKLHSSTAPVTVTKPTSTSRIVLVCNPKVTPR